MKIILAGAIGAAALSLTFSQQANAANPPLTVPIKSCAATHAQVTGQVAAFPGGVGAAMREFLGVPYAASTAGANRWQPPKTFCWSGSRTAFQFSQTCPEGVAGSEDCLYLNIFTPPTGTLSKLPVMVFIHGGALIGGTGGYFGQNPANLVAKGVIVVTINYRLGAFGFLAHPALDKVSTHNTGNYGLLDQQAALKWIKTNIQPFGGDPANVTIFGQSAGGLSVLIHLLSPLSKGLFQKAIIESGALYNAPTPLSTAEATGMTFAAALHCNGTSAATAKCLRNASLATILANQGILGSSVKLVKVDNVVLKDTIKNLLMAGQFQKVPIIQGSNHDEQRFHLAQNTGNTGTGDSCHFQSNLVPDAQANFAGAVTYSNALMNTGIQGPLVSQIQGQYPAGSSPLTVNEAFAAALTDANFACRAWRVDGWIAAAGGKIYAYEFNDEKSPQPMEGPLKLHGGGTMPYGAYHGVELQYLFPMPATVACGAPYAKLSATQKVLAADMVTYWTTFAKTGNPNPATGTKPPAWPLYTNASRTMLSLVAGKPAALAANTFDQKHKCGAFWNTASP